MPGGSVGLTIGRWPEWSVTAARERAKELRRDIDGGIELLSLRETSREAPRVGEVLRKMFTLANDWGRADGEPYAALIGSAYIRRDEGWKLAFHQHSPL